jgi:hypothetical protein
MTTAITEVTITPRMLSEAFWGMCSSEQVEVFLELSKVIKEDQLSGNNGAYSQGELQWYCTGKYLLKPENKEARSMLMTVAAPLYLNTLRFAGE